MQVSVTSVTHPAGVFTLSTTRTCQSTLPAPAAAVANLDAEASSAPSSFSSPLKLLLPLYSVVFSTLLSPSCYGTAHP